MHVDCLKLRCASVFPCSQSRATPLEKGSSLYSELEACLFLVQYLHRRKAAPLCSAGVDLKVNNMIAWSSDNMVSCQIGVEAKRERECVCVRNTTSETVEMKDQGFELSNCSEESCLVLFPCKVGARMCGFVPLPCGIIGMVFECDTLKERVTTVSEAERNSAILDNRNCIILFFTHRLRVCSLRSFDLLVPAASNTFGSASILTHILFLGVTV